MSEWDFLTLEEAGVQLIDCVHKTPAALASGLPYVAIPQLRRGEIDLSDARRISAADFEEWTKRANPQPFDVVLSRRCNPGETAYVRPGMKFALGQNLVLLRADGKRVRPAFLRWMVRSPYWWAEINKFLNVGAVFDSLRCADVPKFSLPLPPLSQQDTAASLLGALDDKIDLNRRMNETLEAMAKELFKDWFVDFGPTRAKTDGRTPYLAREIWTIFPDRLDTENKPEGWTPSTIGEEVTVVGGTTPSTKEPAYWDGDFAWATPKDLSSLRAPVLLKTERQITRAGLSQIGSGLLPVGSVLLSSRAPIGYLVISLVPTAINQGFIGMICDRRLSNIFVWLWTHANMDTIHQKANGSTFQEISKTNFRPIPCLIASPNILKAFDAILNPIFDRIGANAHEAVALTTTRDFLLPKLMSGEIRIRDAEKLVEKVT